MKRRGKEIWEGETSFMKVGNVKARGARQRKGVSSDRGALGRGLRGSIGLHS